MDRDPQRSDVVEINEVLALIRGLADGTIPASERPRIMARKRRLVERLEPGFYDTHIRTDADDDASRHRLETEAVALAATQTPAAGPPAGTGGRIVEAWSLVEGDVHLPATEADWWGATLSILVAAIHQPELLADQQPDTDPAAVAREVLDELGPLRDALELAEGAHRPDRPEPTTGVVSSRGEGTSRRVVISPGDELRQLVWLLDLFAHAVLEPGQHAAANENVTIWVAGAWSRELGVASGAIQ